MASTKKNNRPKPVVLAILDGWGVAPKGVGNAIAKANKPNIDAFTSEYFSTTLQAAGEAVGLKWGEVGNSEVGHLNIGAGKVIFQPQPSIDKAIIDGSFFKNKALLYTINQAKKNKKSLHLLGLISDTGVHATIEHLFALLELAKKNKIEQVYIHAILDGRDATFNSGLKYIERLQAKMTEIGVGRIASISGRFWAMDRDNRWPRIEKAYKAIAMAESDRHFTDPHAAIQESYKNNIFDEQFEPAVAVDEKGKPIAKISVGDGIIFFNFRADRSRQMSRALIDEGFTDFTREYIQDLRLTTFTEYDVSLTAAIAFPRSNVVTPLAKVISDARLRQLHVAETEKYAHITYFINGGREKPFPGEERSLVPSPPVTSYEEKPEMSALEIREKVVAAVEDGNYDFIAVNFANADMVGHSGNMEATIRAIEVLDLCLGNIAKAIIAKGGVLCITADHGNAESMKNINTAEINKKHTSLPVPFMIIGDKFKLPSILPEVPDMSLILSAGILSDIAPTILKILNLKKPNDMTGRSLI